MLIGDFGVQINYYNGTWTATRVSPPLADESGEIESPYRGLSQFEQRDERFFFGRETAAKELVGRISEQLDTSGLLVVSGVSGAGKSSLLRAGVLPRIRAGELAAPGSDSWPRLVLTPTASPLDELAAKIAPIARTEPAIIRTNLTDDPASFALTARQAVAAQAPEHDGTDGRRLILVVDQFEQLFTQCPDETQRRAFITALRAAATGRPGPSRRPGALVILVLRADFEPRCAEYPELEPAVQDRYLLTSMTERQLRLAITEPAKRAGATVDDDLVDALLREMLDPASASSPGGARRVVVSGAGALPLLSHALDRAWRGRTGDTLTLADYERTGGIEGAVAATAERAYERISPDQREVAQRVLPRLVATSDDGVDTARPVARTELTGGENAADVETILETFASERLLTLAAGTVEITHEVLLTAWPLLRDWLADTRTHRAVRTRLQRAAEEWNRNSRDRSYLYQGTRLVTAITTADRIRTDPRYQPLSRGEHEFLQASARARERVVRTRRLVTAVLAVLAVTTMATAGLTGYLSNRTAAQLARVNAEALGRESQSRAPTDIAVAAQLALAAWRSDPTSPLARTALANAYLAMPTLDAEFADLTTDPAVTVDLGGDTAAVYAANSVVILTGITGPSPRRWEIPDLVPSRTDLSPDGRWFAYLTNDNRLQIRDVPARSEPRTVATGQRPDGYPRFSSNSSRLAFLAGDGEPGMWDVTTGATIPNGVGTRLGNDVAGLWFTPDRNQILVRHGSVRTPGTRLVLHSLTDGAELATMPPTAIVARDGAEVVSCEQAQVDDDLPKPMVTVTHVGTPQPPTRFALDGPTCPTGKLSSDGGWLITTIASRASQTVLRLTDLRGGLERQVIVKSISVDFDIRRQTPISVENALGVSSAAGEPTVMFAHGTSLLRLRTEPALKGLDRPITRRLADGGRYVSVISPKSTETASGATVAVDDAASGQRIATIPGQSSGTNPILVGNSLWLVNSSDGLTRIDRYDISPLRMAATFVPPGSERRSPGSAIALAEERATMLLTIYGRVLAALDPMTGRPLAPPVTLPPRDAVDEIGYEQLVARPEHPGQVAVWGRREVQIWDARGGDRLATIPLRAAENSSMAFDRSGRRIAILTENKTIEIWDVESVAPVRPPIASADAGALLGFDADGYLDTVSAQGDRLAFIDTEKGQEAGAMSSVPDVRTAAALHGAPVVSVDDTRMAGARPYELPLTAQAWRDRLCAVASRPFTDAELRLLPRGTDPNPPCS
ncbi:hypothetical protein [Pseudonocardia acaciae]|uniref:nSTAND1 domain-containing NTPase n=1 Tax=Pseudonocardia acaciae TaxID=551276 RepID=UPI00048D4165|nr:hypothetical protein [Pseudonocardia acaciae]